MWDQRSHKQATSSHSLFSASQGAAPTHFVKIPICSCTWEVSRHLRVASLRGVGRAWSTRPWTCVPTSSPHDFPTWEHPFRSIKTLATVGWGTDSTCFTRLVRPLQRDPSQPAMKLTTMALVCLLLVGTWLQDGDSWSLHVSSSNCCFTSVRKAISPKSILCYRNSSSSCSHQDRLIFKLKGGKKSCALKTDKWVTAVLRKIKPCLPTEM
ncbi:PREDICTED: uncharacterized protein LOC106726430 [Myotis brandtii]|uniref:uncharacterized protein LOC106726430 n=1 Tax=Myotis brandtii TaxID=109478 RepID=UPI000703FF78|nr:PREDICTED: uncharacterized protein LOC106726430 [Myotis brandtii]